MGRTFWFQLGSAVAVGLVAAFGVQAAPRPDLVAKVGSGEIAEARLSWWGYDPVDATKIVETALASGVRKLIVDRMPSPWMVRPLKGASNQEILFERGAVVMAKKGEFHGKSDFLLTYAESTNVVLSGYGATIAMRIDDYTNKALYAWSEWRHALTLSGVRNVRVEGLTFDGSGGDGIYFGSAGVGRHCRDVVVRDVTCTRNNRQGMSVISAANLLIENCRLVKNNTLDNDLLSRLSHFLFEIECCRSHSVHIFIKSKAFVFGKKA